MLKLKALDTEDLQVISAQMQDALVRVSDFDYDPKSRRFSFVANRFAWDSQPANERRRTGLRFENVLSAKRRGFRNTAFDTILSLLAINFEPVDAPAGKIILTFSAGHVIQLDVEYLDCAMRDLGPAWSSEHAPQHDK